jgi:catechol 2,3-dioxygenase-like lactoylglutathione lyase family enzyme
MFDHVVLSVKDLDRAVAFYTATLKPLGITNRVSFPGYPGHAPLEGFGDDDERYLLLKKAKPTPSAVHLAFRATSKKVVDAFYKAAIAAGATDNGPPGPRPKYFAAYYAAYVLDLDGYNVEAVYQG